MPYILPVLLLLALLTGSSAAHASTTGTETDSTVPTETEAGPNACSRQDESISVPQGFCAEMVADGLGRVRHIVVRDNGDLYARLMDSSGGGSVVALRDTDGDGRFEREERFFNEGGTGIGLWRDYLYFSTPRTIYRQKLMADQLLPTGPVQSVVAGFPPQGQHAAKSFAISPAGDLFVNIGAPSNACQEQTRSAGSPGLEPCPQLKNHAGIWRFAADRSNQTPADGQHYASGIRNAVAISWNRTADRLFAVQHGRDQLHQLWPEFYSVEDNARLPAEEFFLIEEGDDFGWPYCYYDQVQERKVLAPEYGGNGKKVGRCDEFKPPIMAFPGHWAPNGLHFYTGSQFPPQYRDGAFIAFHGSWNRAPLPQQGYKVVFVPFRNNRPAGGWDDFATGFAGREQLKRSSQARYRPMGLSQGPDGALFISDSQQGRIWRIRYIGKP